MRRKITAFGGGAALVIAAITIPATTAAAADYDIDVDFPSNWAQTESTLTWSIEDTADPICDDATVIINGGSQPADIINVNDDGLGGEIDLAAAAAEDLFIMGFTFDCDQDTYEGYVAFHSVDVYKAVEGESTSQDLFEIELSVLNFDDSEFSDTILFRHGGGSVTYYGFEEAEWSIEEIRQGNAYRVDTDDALEIDTPDAYQLGVTNYFPVQVDGYVTVPSDPITTETELDWESDPSFPAVCEDGEVFTSYWDSYAGDEVPLDAPFDISVGDQGYSGTINVEGAPGPGDYYTDVLCEVDGDQFVYWIDVRLDSFELTKQVEGDAPAGTTFDIEVSVTEATLDDDDNVVPGPDTDTLVISFPETGGTQTLYHYVEFDGSPPVFWDVEEIEDGGADDVEINIASAFYADGYPGATVINTFEVQEPVDDPVDDPKDDPKKDDPKDESAAKPVKVTPTYAG